jgi:hypothetical protein
MASTNLFRLNQASSPHPTWQSKTSRNRVIEFLQNIQTTLKCGLRLNLGSASRRFRIKILNLDLVAENESREP